ncbi:hypothetical protein F0562_009756 [Nyssa sinensis]|uniref:G protein gamma domain-containing protein n=1 Tax=Nyssa sinensis TaxID=561372 RepID=A0A5J4ZWT6_9ASTE|nr:hypothetical protein F0562_009756 [Nyssa sinensis]
MAASGCSPWVPSLPPPRPKSPPQYPDLYGKRRELLKVQMLEREIGFLEDELKSIDGLQSASRCCKEVADFVVANSDPLIPESQKIHRSCRFWKWLCGASSCFNFSWICCYGCCPHLEVPHCCRCNLFVQCQSATVHVSNAIRVSTVIHVSVVHYQSASVRASVVQYQSASVASGRAPYALARSHAAEVVAVFNALPARIALAADGHVLVLNVQRYTFVPLVQKTVATLAVFVASIIMQ